MENDLDKIKIDFEIFFKEYKDNWTNITNNMELILNHYIPSKLDVIFNIYRDNEAKLLILIELINKIYFKDKTHLFEKDMLNKNNDITRLIELNKEVILKFLYILQNQNIFKKFIVNSICNYIGNCFKFLILSQIHLLEIYDKIEQIFLIDNLDLNYRFSKILFYIMENFLINKNVYEYSYFRILCIRFSKNFLYKILSVIRTNLLRIINPVSPNLYINYENILCLNLDILLKILEFPLNINYNYFENGVINRFNNINYTSNFNFFFNDLSWLKSLFYILIYTNNDNKTPKFYKIKLNISKILRRILLTNKIMFADFNLFIDTILENLKFFLQSVNIFKEIQEELKTEFINFNIILLNKIDNLKLKKDESKVQLINILEPFYSNFIQNNSISFSNININLFFKFIKDLKPDILDQLLDLYWNKFLVLENNIFIDCEFKNIKEFLNLINTRFKNYEDIPKLINKKSSDVLMKYSNNILDIFNNINSDELLEKHLKIYLPKIIHLYLLCTYFIIKIKRITKGGAYLDGLENISDENQYKYLLNNVEVLNFLQKNAISTINLTNKFNLEILINYIWAVNYFLKHLFYCFTDKLENSKDNILVSDDWYFDLFKKKEIDYNIADFIKFYFNYLFSLLNLKNKSIIKYTISNLNNIFIRFKNLKKFKTNIHPLLIELFNRLLDIENTIFVIPEFYKFRKKYFVLISKILLNNMDGEYIQNSILLKNIILNNNSKDNIDNYIRIFRDLSGVIISIQLPKILIYFLRIVYHYIQNMLKNIDNTNLNNYNFKVSLTNFYLNCFKFPSNFIDFKFSNQIIIDIINDSFNIIKTYIINLNNFFELNNTQKLNYISNEIDFFKNFLKLLLNIMNYYKFILLKITEEDFNNFIKNLSYFIFNILGVVEFFPNHSKLFIEIFHSLITNFFEKIILLDVDLFGKILDNIGYFYNYYWKDDNLWEENKNNFKYIEEIVIYIVKYIHNELKIIKNENYNLENYYKEIWIKNHDKVKNLISSNFYSLQKTDLKKYIENSSINIIFYLLIIIDNYLINDLFLQMLTYLNYNDDNKKIFLKVILNDIQFNLKKFNLVNFKKNLNEYITKIKDYQWINS